MSTIKTSDSNIFQYFLSRQKPFLLLFSFSVFSFFGFSQNQEKGTELKVVKTTETGVVVYESGGVEGFKKAPTDLSTSERMTKPISEWNMEECDNGLYGVNSKIATLENNGSPETDIEGYRKAKSEIMQRKEELIKLLK